MSMNELWETCIKVRENDPSVTKVVVGLQANERMNWSFFIEQLQDNHTVTEVEVLVSALSIPELIQLCFVLTANSAIGTVRLSQLMDTDRVVMVLTVLNHLKRQLKFASLGFHYYDIIPGRPYPSILNDSTVTESLCSLVRGSPHLTSIDFSRTLDVDADLNHLAAIGEAVQSSKAFANMSFGHIVEMNMRCLRENCTLSALRSLSIRVTMDSELMELARSFRPSSRFESFALAIGGHCTVERTADFLANVIPTQKSLRTVSVLISHMLNSHYQSHSRTICDALASAVRGLPVVSAFEFGVEKRYQNDPLWDRKDISQALLDVLHEKTSTLRCFSLFGTVGPHPSDLAQVASLPNLEELDLVPTSRHAIGTLSIPLSYDGALSLLSGIQQSSTLRKVASSFDDSVPDRIKRAIDFHADLNWLRPQKLKAGIENMADCLEEAKPCEAIYPLILGQISRARRITRSRALRSLDLIHRLVRDNHAVLIPSSRSIESRIS